MAWDGNGNFIRTNGVFSGADTWEDQAASADAFINSGRHDTHDEDLATGIENTVTRDGQNSALQNLPMAAKRHTQVGNALTRDNYAAAGQVQDDAFNYIPPPNVGGTGDAITLAPSPAITNYEIGQYFAFKVELNNTTEITINVSGLGATAVQKDDGRVMFADDFLAGALAVVRYDGAAFLWQNQQVPIRIQGAMVQGDANGNATELKLGTSGQVPQVSNDGLEVVYGPPLARGYKDGLITSNNATDALKDIDITAGVAKSQDNLANLVSDAAIGKQIDVSWAPGGTPATPTGGLSSSLTLTADTEYHVIVGLVSGVVEAGFDTSPTGANLIADHGFSNTRRVATVFTDATPDIIPYTQTNDMFLLDVQALDEDNTNPGIAAVLVALSVPKVAGIRAITSWDMTDTTAAGNTNILITAISQADMVPGSALFTIRVTNNAGGQSNANAQTILPTDPTTGEVRYRMGSTTNSDMTMKAWTTGWYDQFGKDA